MNSPMVQALILEANAAAAGRKPPPVVDAPDDIFAARVALALERTRDSIMRRAARERG
jgi:hypothetical protein